MRLGSICCLLLIALTATAKPPKKKDYLVTLTTDYGTMHLILHPETPKHRDNFIKLVDKKFHDGLLFHRVIQNFMIQGGDPDSKGAEAGKALGNGDVGYRVPAEFVPTLFHKKGALAAARDNNPEKSSSGCQFYIVQGRVWDEAGLEKQMARSGRTFTEAQKQTYRTVGGSPHLDGNYTVFGQVIDGLSVIDSIAAQPRDARDRPVKDVRMTVSGEWMKKKKITKQFGYTY
ncbi:peptidylprolyl isomerase [Tellurirhabdus rosea]|uniref:peptidylprolyl isomerase n=1 Tax=Tellurirhabdus rosea TaxID=2674997 RepID=UPI002250476E|nr:peptidylprolyl isomerase [Tellurirhabdus rosea]